MLPKRAGGESGEYRPHTGEIAQQVEAARSAAESSAPAKDKEHSDEKISLFWRIFGGTILSMVTLGAITLYNSISSNIAELRAELSREREARTEFVKKDEFSSRSSNLYERIRSFEGVKAELEGLKERINANAATLGATQKDVAAMTDSTKKDAAALEVLKERVAMLDGLKKDVAGIESLREKLALAATDLKTMREEVTRLQKEQDRNQSSDMERKMIRDAQHKQFDEALKELQKGLQDCREKIARLEGARAQPKKGSNGKSSMGGGD